MNTQHPFAMTAALIAMALGLIAVYGLELGLIFAVVLAVVYAVAPDRTAMR